MFITPWHPKQAWNKFLSVRLLSHSLFVDAQYVFLYEFLEKTELIEIKQYMNKRFFIGYLNLLYELHKKIMATQHTNNTNFHHFRNYILLTLIL